MKARFGKIGHSLYCDAGPYAGDMRIDLTIRLYLSPEEYARYDGSESLQITLHESGDGHLQSGSTAEPSGELPAGEVPIAIASAGWKPVPGGPSEGAVHEHGTAPCRARPANPRTIPLRRSPNHDCP